MKPLVLTVGEPAGIGPELALKARRALGADLPFVLLGDPRFFEPAEIAVIETCEAAVAVAADRLPVLAVNFGAAAVPGQPLPAHAAHVIEVIARAVAMVQAGEAAALVTNPINKEALKRGAGFAFPGHTEFLAHLAGVPRVVMMIASPLLRVVPVTIHEALVRVPGLLTAELLRKTVEITHAALIRDFGIARPRLALAGLNPHAGENGLMGTEDDAVIRPVVAEFRARGFDITGPWPADTMFHARARERYDVAIAMYHDQALIPAKTLAFDEGVNVTLGLPFVRASPDHGTAFDIAGKGKANPSSLIAALRLAADMAKRHGSN